MEKVQRTSLECQPLDELLKGGVEHGIITNFYGASGTGKTNVCIQAAASCIDKGKNTLYIDTEGGFSAERFLQMNGNEEEHLEDLVMMEPATFEEQKQAFSRLDDLVEQENIKMIIVDSLVALYRIKLQEEVSESNRELSRQLSILSKIARKKDIPVIVTNQVYSSFKTDDITMVGRDVPTYWSKCLVRLEKVSENTRKAVLKKHRSRPEGLSKSFRLGREGLMDTENGVEEEIL